MQKVTGYFIGQLSEGYKLHSLQFTSYSLYDMIEFIKPRGGVIWDENYNVLYSFPFNVTHWVNNPTEQVFNV